MKDRSRSFTERIVTVLEIPFIVLKEKQLEEFRNHIGHGVEAVPAVVVIIERYNYHLIFDFKKVLLVYFVYFLIKYKRQTRRSTSSSSSSYSSKSQYYRKGRKRNSRARSGDRYENERVNRKTTASRKMRSRSSERNDKTKSSEKIPYFADSRREEERIVRRKKLMEVMKQRQRERSRSRDRHSQRRSNNTIPERRENRYR